MPKSAIFFGLLTFAGAAACAHPAVDPTFAEERPVVAAMPPAAGMSVAAAAPTPVQIQRAGCESGDQLYGGDPFAPSAWAGFGRVLGGGDVETRRSFFVLRFECH